MTAWLVVNGFLHSKKFNEIHKWLLNAAIKRDIQLELKTNDTIMISLSENINFIEQIPVEKRPEFVLFWDKDIRLAQALEKMGLPVFNSSEGIARCDDKSLTHLLLSKNHIPMPETIIAPMTYSNIGYTDFSFIREIEESLGYPMVLKECFGSFGQQVYLVHNQTELKKQVKILQGIPFLFQKFITYSAGRDIRLQVVGNQVVASMYRYTTDGDFRANITNGGSMKPYEPTEEEKNLAIRCCKILGLDFAGVDLLFADEKTSLVCEVNSNAHFKNIYDCTGVNTADYIIEYILHRLHFPHKQ